MALDGYTEDEVAALKGIFSIFDHDGSGAISSKELEAILEKVGKDPGEAEELLRDVDPDRSGSISFEEFLELLKKTKAAPSEVGEQPDPKVLEFLKILDEYRKKCEIEGNYLEAGRASQQLDTLRKQEQKRQAKALKARQLAERQDVQIAHNMQFTEFNASWDKYMEEYDQMAQMYIQQMTEKHAIKLREFQEKLHKEMMNKPPKFSRELLDWRRRQHLLAKQKNYAEAQKIKRIADLMEQKERGKIDGDNRKAFGAKERKFRMQQQAELAALLKRIEGRRKEHIKQRALDSKRLLQRNRNVQAVLESKQSVEGQKKLQELRSMLIPGNRDFFESQKKREEELAASRARQSGGAPQTS